MVMHWKNLKYEIKLSKICTFDCYKYTWLAWIVNYCEVLTKVTFEANWRWIVLTTQIIWLSSFYLFPLIQWFFPFVLKSFFFVLAKFICFDKVFFLNFNYLSNLKKLFDWLDFEMFVEFCLNFKFSYKLNKTSHNIIQFMSKCFCTSTKASI